MFDKQKNNKKVRIQMNEPTFNREKMIKLQKQDMWIDRLVTDLTKKLGSEEEALEIVFNSEILDGYDYREVYEGLYVLR